MMPRHTQAALQELAAQGLSPEHVVSQDYEYGLLIGRSAAVPSSADSVLNYAQVLTPATYAGLLALVGPNPDAPPPPARVALPTYTVTHQNDTLSVSGVLTHTQAPDLANPGAVQAAVVTEALPYVIRLTPHGIEVTLTHGDGPLASVFLEISSDGRTPVLHVHDGVNGAEQDPTVFLPLLLDTEAVQAAREAREHLTSGAQREEHRAIITRPWEAGTAALVTWRSGTLTSADELLEALQDAITTWAEQRQGNVAFLDDFNLGDLTQHLGDAALSAALAANDIHDLNVTTTTGGSADWTFDTVLYPTDDD